MQEMMAVLGGRGKGSWRILKKLIGRGKWVEWGGRCRVATAAA